MLLRLANTLLVSDSTRLHAIVILIAIIRENSVYFDNSRPAFRNSRFGPTVNNVKVEEQNQLTIAKVLDTFCRKDGKIFNSFAWNMTKGLAAIATQRSGTLVWET